MQGAERSVSAAPLTALGVASAWVGSLAWLWSLLARQSPDSPWRVAGFAAAIDSLGVVAFVQSALIFSLGFAAWRASLGAHRTLAKVTLALLYAGSAMLWLAMGYAAATGVMGVQIRNTGQSGHWVLALKACGALSLLSALAVASRALLSPPREA